MPPDKLLIFQIAAKYLKNEIDNQISEQLLHTFWRDSTPDVRYLKFTVNVSTEIILFR